jgi:hypothetical protein
VLPACCRFLAGLGYAISKTSFQGPFLSDADVEVGAGQGMDCARLPAKLCSPMPWSPSHHAAAVSAVSAVLQIGAVGEVGLGNLFCVRKDWLAKAAPLSLQGVVG